MDLPKSITTVQAGSILISTIIGVGILGLPRVMANAANTGAPLATLMGVLLGGIGIGIVTMLGVRFPKMVLAQYAELILGKTIGRIGNVVIIIFFIGLTALTARDFGEVIVTAVLKKTPVQVIIITMLLMAMVAAGKEINVFAYLHNFYLPFILAPVLLISALSLKNSHLLYLEPIWGNQRPELWHGVLTVAGFFQGSFIFSLVIPAMYHPKKAGKAAFWSVLVVGCLFVLVVAAVISVFGPQETKLLLWPTLELAKLTSLPGLLERMDAVFLVVWVTAVFTTLLSSYFLAVRFTSDLFRLRDYKMMPVFLMPVIFLLAVLPQNIFQLYRILETFSRWGLCLTIGYPLVLWGISKIRKKGGKYGASKPLGKGN